MSIPLREDAILAEFDRRNRAGHIFYDDRPEVQVMDAKGFKFEFVVTGAISKKPYIKDNADEPSAANPALKRPQGYALGSDIDVSGYEIADVGTTHLLAYNKFCMYRPHMLLLTQDGYRRQYEPLDLDDFRSAWYVLGALNWNYFMFFNCGKDGGCSRLHKHLQIAPYLPGRLRPWPETDSGEAPHSCPYHYIYRRFESDISVERLKSLYDQMMSEAQLCLERSEEDALHHIPHNVALGKNWVIVIPRRKAGVGGAYANTLGMLGMVSVASGEELRCWLDQGPREVVSQLGVPAAAGITHAGAMTNGEY